MKRVRKHLARRQRKRLERKRKRTEAHKVAQLKNSQRRRDRRDGRSRLIAGMTNWQRNQWARAGYPQRRLDDVRRFAALERRA